LSCAAPQHQQPLARAGKTARHHPFSPSPPRNDETECGAILARHLHLVLHKLFKTKYAAARTRDNLSAITDECMPGAGADTPPISPPCRQGGRHF
jgi:hypothetical protein